MTAEVKQKRTYTRRTTQPSADLNMLVNQSHIDISMLANEVARLTKRIDEIERRCYGVNSWKDKIKETVSVCLRGFGVHS